MTSPNLDWRAEAEKALAGIHGSGVRQGSDLPDDEHFTPTDLHVVEKPQYLIVVTAYGDPAPQGSKTLIRFDRNGNLLPKPILVESADISGDNRAQSVKQFREGIGWHAHHVLGKMPPEERRLFPVDGPLVAAMVFTVRRTTAADRPDAPTVRPDLSKYLRAAEDALKGIVWTDDARVIGYDLVWKTYPGRHPWALDRPGVRIGVRRATHEELGLERQSRQGRKYTRLLEQWDG